jgi:hypothetical protein
MFPGVIEVEVSVVAAAVVADPDSTIHVRGIGMIRLVAEVAALIAMIISAAAVRRRLVIVAAIRRRPARRRLVRLMFLTAAVFVLLQSERRNANHQ